jgi:signal peptidase
MSQAHSSKLLSWIASIVQTVLVVALVLVAVASFGARIPWLAQRGLTLYAVTSGSMEPMIPTGSLIYAKAFKADDLKEGDIVTFQVTSEGSTKPVIVTHRLAGVNKIQKTTKGPDGVERTTVEYSFRTKGDANKQEDGQTIGLAQILGKYAWHIPQVGKVALWAQTPPGFTVMVILPTIILVGWEIAGWMQHIKKTSHQKAEKAEAEISRLKAELAEAKKD